MSQDRDGEGLATLGLPTLMSVLEHLPDACTLSRAVRDADGRAMDMVLLWMNAVARAGQPHPESAIGGRCSQLWPGLVENGAFAACMRVLDTGVPERGEFDWTEGTTYRASYYDWRATRVEGDLLLWVLRDASDRITQVLASEARLHAILKTAPDAIIVIDESGVVVDSNAACERLLGWPPDALIGQSVSTMMVESDAAKHGNAVERYLRTGVRNIIGTGREVVARRRDGTTVPVRLSVGEARVGGRRLFTGILHDLTQQHALAEQLRHAQRMQTAGRLVSRVAHDFNNLLTIMTTTASLLEHMVDDPEARALLGEIVDAAQRGSALNRQLLSTTRAEVQTPSVIDVNELVQSTTKLARRLVGSGIHVDVDLRAGGWAVRADANALEQALLNLVANARDAMPSGGNVALSADRYVLDADDDDLPAGRYVRITVEDDGDGMPPEVLARAGEAFFTTKPTGRGTGLGLASVMETVRRADGRVRIESHAGRGTTVELFLPVVEAMAPSSRATGAVFRGSERVLFVDDDETIRRLVPRALRAKGYDVITASNAQEARAIFEEQPHVQVLVTDVVMIGVSGPELAAELRRQRPDLKVLFVSGYTPQHVLSLRDLPDGSAFVSKPCTPRQIAAKLRELLDHREDPVDLSP